MSKFVPMLFLMGLFFFMWLLLYAHQRKERQKRALPLREDFLAAHGKAEPSCQGLGSGKDTRRIVSCTACDTLLYRYERPAEAEAS